MGTHRGRRLGGLAAVGLLLICTATFGLGSAAASGDDEMTWDDSLIAYTVPDKAAIDLFLANDIDLAEYVSHNEDGTLTIAAIVTAEEIATLRGLGFEPGHVIEDKNTYKERIAERNAALAAENKAQDLAETGRSTQAFSRSATVGDLTIMRVDYFTNYAGRFLSVEARTSLGTPTGGPTLAFSWKTDDAGAAYGAATTMSKFTDTDPSPDVYMYHRQLIRIGALGTTTPVPAFVRVASSTGATDEQAVKPWLAGGLPPYAAEFQTGFFTAYMDPTQLYARTAALAAEFPDIAEEVTLPNKTNGYQRKAMGVMAGTTAIGTAPSTANQNGAVYLETLAYGHQGGNQVQVQFLNPGAANAPLSVSVLGSMLSVSLGTSSTGALSSTAAQVVAAINASPAASAIVSARTYGTNTGAGITQARATVNLSDFLAAPASVTRGPFQPKVLRIGKVRDGSKVGVFLYCQQHAREWATPLTCLETAERLLRNYATDPLTRELVDNLDIFILPSSNPDGSHHSLYDFPSQRKNLTNYCAPVSASSMPSARNGWGVDLNRNNTVGTLFDGYVGASTSCTNELFAGPFEASEPEIRNELWVADTFTNIKFANNIHSFGGYFMWAPGSYTSNRTTLPAPNIGIEGYFFQAGDRILQRIKEVRDTVILPQRTGPIADVLYSAAGNSADDQWYRRGIISYSFETGADRFTSTSSGTSQSQVGFQPNFASEGRWEALEFASGNYGLLESALDYARDETAPVADAVPGQAAQQTPVDVTFKWINEPSVIHYTTDGSTPTLASPTWNAIGPRQPGQTFTFSSTTTLKWIAKDIKGNVSAVRTARFAVESDAPVTTATVAPAPLGGFYRTPMVTLAAADGPDGAGVGAGGTEYNVDGGPWLPYAAPFAVTGDGPHVIGYHSTDLAGNVEPVRELALSIDATKPTIALTRPAAGASYGLDQVVLAAFACSDALSGVATCEGTVDDGDALNTASVGTKSFTVDAADAAGNTQTVTRTYEVIWDRFAGFFAPVNNGGVVNVAQPGSTIPVKFSLGGNYGLNVLAAGYPKSVAVACSSSAPTDDIESTSSPGESTFSFSEGQYHYNWKTEKAWAGTCRQLQVKLRDNTVHTALFRFKG